MDAAAVRSVLSRQGVGRIRYLEVKVLWTQDQVKSCCILIEKVVGIRKPAGLGTKRLGEETMVRQHRSLRLTVLPEVKETKMEAAV